MLNQTTHKSDMKSQPHKTMGAFSSFVTQHAVLEHSNDAFRRKPKPKAECKALESRPDRVSGADAVAHVPVAASICPQFRTVGPLYCMLTHTTKIDCCSHMHHAAGWSSTATQMQASVSFGLAKAFPSRNLPPTSQPSHPACSFCISTGSMLPCRPISLLLLALS